MENWTISWEDNSDSLYRSPFSIEHENGEFREVLHPCPARAETRVLTLSEAEAKRKVEELSSGLRRWEFDASADAVMAEAREILSQFE